MSSLRPATAYLRRPPAAERLAGAFLAGVRRAAGLAAAFFAAGFFTAAFFAAGFLAAVFSALAFSWLMRSGIYPPELRSVNLDSDWLYRRLFCALGVLTALHERVRQDYLATAGFQGTLTALQEGKVDTLIIAQDQEREGARCTQCGFIFAREVESCPYDGAATSTGVNVVEEAIRLAETYLLAAEAEMEQGKLDEAAAHLNVVRRRANASEISAGEVTLDDEVFGVDIKAEILHMMVNYQLHKRRAGTHKVKTRGEVAGRPRIDLVAVGTRLGRQVDLGSRDAQKADRISRRELARFVEHRDR